MKAHRKIPSGETSPSIHGEDAEVVFEGQDPHYRGQQQNLYLRGPSRFGNWFYLMEPLLRHLFHQPTPQGIYLLGFTDDVTLVVVAHNAELLE